MKFLFTGDWHLRYKAPRLRKDNYFETQYGKIEQILKIAEENKVNYILQPGDMFDSIDTPWFVVAEYINLFKKYNIPILCVAGQHDMRFHSRDLSKTPLSVMEASGVIKILKNEPKEIGKISIYGSSWGQDIPDPNYWYDPPNCDGCEHILVIHKMIVDTKLWEGQQDYVYANNFLRSNPFDIIVSGDNHKRFEVSLKGKDLVNCGSLMRSNINQLDHKPCVYIYDSTKEELYSICLQIKPVEEVFDTNKAEEAKEQNEKLDAFVNSLSDSKLEIELNFVENLYNTMDSIDVDKGVRDIIEEVLNG